MQHYRSVSNTLTEQAANECNSFVARATTFKKQYDSSQQEANPYVARATTFTKQYNSSQQEAVMEICMTVMHSTLKRS